MSETPDGYVKLEDNDFYQQVAFDTQGVVFGVMNQLAIALATSLRPDIKEPSGVDGGALIGGALGGILQFAMHGGMADSAAVRQVIIEQMDTILPQITMSMAVDSAGAVGSGRA